MRHIYLLPMMPLLMPDALRITPAHVCMTAIHTRSFPWQALSASFHSTAHHTRALRTTRGGLMFLHSTQHATCAMRCTACHLHALCSTRSDPRVYCSSTRFPVVALFRRYSDVVHQLLCAAAVCRPSLDICMPSVRALSARHHIPAPPTTSICPDLVLPSTQVLHSDERVSTVHVSGAILAPL